jgi:hypothetical protein
LCSRRDDRGLVSLTVALALALQPSGRMNKTLSSVLFVFAGLALSGCGGAGVISQCEEAQAQDCTVITGSCSKFFDAMDSLSRSKTSCGAQADAYESCVVSHPACAIDANCGSEENALTQCVGVFCLTNASDPDCVYVQENS